MSIDARVHPAVHEWLAAGMTPMVCDGRFVEAVSGRTFQVHDPATAAAIATVPEAGPPDVDAAVSAATTALERGQWGSMMAAERERCLLRLADLVESRAEELQHLIVLENGKLLSAAEREVEGSIRFIRYAAGWATKIAGETLDVGFRAPGTDFFAYTRREPVGVVAGIIPWNMPLGMAVWKSVPPLACGCTVVLKPAEEAPLSALRVAALALEAGVPPGALNVVTGGAATGAALVAHPGVAKVAFTGSTAVGKAIGAAAISRLARVSLELGGKSPVAVFDDVDPDAVAKAVAQGIFYNQGQVCAAGSRLYVQRPLFDEIVGRVGEVARRMRLGSGLDPGADIGPLVSDGQRERVVGYIESGLADGARALAGGRAPSGPGYFVEPTVLTGTTAGMRVVQEEIFGPVLVAMPFDTEDEVISHVNGTRYGLSASLYSQNLARVHRLVPRIQAGMVFVNSPARTDPNLPFGGAKESGLGREHGSSMVDLYTELKSVVIAYTT